MSNSSSPADTKVTVIGIGRLGLCFSLVLESKGYQVLGVDIDPTYCTNLNNKSFHSYEPLVNEYLKESQNFQATTDLDAGINHSDLLFILVDTPSGSSPEHPYDTSKLGSVLQALNERKIRNKHVVISCTVMPGYVAKVGRYLLSDCPGTTLSYNPEFIAQGNIMYGLLHPDMVLLGCADTAAGNRLASLYGTISPGAAICRMNPESAEICKLAVNCFVTMKITFANLIGDLADQTPNADKHSICKALGKDSRIGDKCLTPGHGFGGPCFPRDNRALAQYADKCGANGGDLFRMTDETNSRHTCFQIRQMLEADLPEYSFAGVAYKADTTVPIIEESQRLVLAASLAKAGKRVTICDYPAVLTQVQKLYGGLFQYVSRPVEGPVERPVESLL